MKTIFSTLALFTLLPTLILSAADSAKDIQAPSSEAATRIAWWQDAKFGLFIHWGPVSLVGTEIGWSRAGERRGYRESGTQIPVERYDNLYKEFNPVAYDPAEWVGIAKAAGIKYIVLTTRHHDGFSLWDTAANDYKITSPHSPYGKDIVRALADATRAAGLRFGTYYSQPDWKNPDAFTDRHADYQAYIAQQLRELMTNYGQIDIVWFDGLGKAGSVYGATTVNQMIRELQPKILINNRNGLPEDFDTPEQRVGTMEVIRPWETCMTIARQWAWKPNDKMKSLDECLRILVTTVTGGGNLLLNVGPMPDGRIEPRQVERLKQIGSWLEKNGIAIYNTRGGPWANGSWGGTTHRDRTIYLHLLRPPVGGRLRLAPAPFRITAARHLHEDRRISYTQTDQGVIFELGQAAFKGPFSVVEISVDSPIPKGLVLGLNSGPFDDEITFGRPCQDTALATTSTGDIQKDGQGRWKVKSAVEATPGVTLDLGKITEVTALSAITTHKHNYGAGNVLVRAAISPDGEAWEEIGHSSYGLHRFDLPVTRFVAGIDQPGRSARYLRVWIDYGDRQGTLELGEIKVYAR